MALLSAVLEETPFVTRLVTLALLVTAITDYLAPNVSNLLLVDVTAIVAHYQLWRIFTGWAHDPSLFTAIILIWNVHALLAKYVYISLHVGI